MEDEFTITAELLSFGGFSELFVMRYKKSYQVTLDGQELCVLTKSKEGEWSDLNGDLDSYTIDIIGQQIDEYHEAETFYKRAG